MYFLVVFLSMFFLPFASIGIAYFGFHQSDLALLLGKWFVFWAVGFRCSTAGLRQMIKPEFTVRDILGGGISDDAGMVIVRELGFASFAMGMVALGSLLFPFWTVPAALAGCLFLGLAGVNHMLRRPGNSLEWTATVSNLFVCLALAVYLLSKVWSVP